MVRGSGYLTLSVLARCEELETFTYFKLHSSDTENLARGNLLNEPLELLRIIRTAIVGGPGVADGEFVELEHIHDADFCHRAAVQVRALVNARRCVDSEELTSTKP